MEAHGTRATISALAANIGIAIAKLVAFFFTGSASMLAEAIHSGADSSNQMLLLVGVRRSRRKPTESHPFGFGRERYFWAFVVAVVLFTVGGVASLIEGVEKLRTPHEVTSLAWAIGVLVVAILMESGSLVVAVREANSDRDEGWWSFIRTAKAPEIPVLLLEDSGALIGLFLALAGVSLAVVTHEPRFDALGSLAIGVLLCVIAVVLAIELRSLLIGEAATLRDAETIDAAIREAPELEELIDAKTVHIGPDHIMVGAKVRLRPDLTFTEVVGVINEMEQRIRTRVPSAATVYIEPDND